MAVPVTRRRRAGRRKMTGRMAEIKERIGSITPSRRRPAGGRPSGSAPTTRVPASRKRPAGSAAPTKSLDALRAAARSRAGSSGSIPRIQRPGGRGQTSGGSSTPGTGPTPATTPRPGTRGKSAFAASRTGRPPAHGARRQGKTPGAGYKPPTRPGGSPRQFRVDPRETASATPVGSVSSSPKLDAAKRRISSVSAMPKVKARKRGRTGY